MSERVQHGPRVFLDDEDDAPTRPTRPERLDFGWERAVAPVVPPPRARNAGGLGRIAFGILVLLAGFAALEVVNFVFAQFWRGAALGWATLAVALAGAVLVALGAWAELRGLLSLRAVDHGRAAFLRGDVAAARAEALRWAGRVEGAAALRPALRDAPDAETLRGLLEAGPLAALSTRAQALGRAAAAQAFAVTAVSPWPGLDALVFTWRGLRLVRDVAALHGVRPGAAATVALLRRVLVDAATIAATDVAVDAAARALLSGPLGAIAGEAAAGAVAARRMLRLARAADEACRIVPGR